MHRRAGIASAAEPGSKFIAQYKGFVLHRGLHMYRLATEYAEYKTLHYFILRYVPATHRTRDFAQRQLTAEA